MLPDGRSLITSVGNRQNTVWLHDSSGEHQISSEGNADSPMFTAAGRIYYVARTSAYRAGTGELWTTNLASGRAEPALPGVDLKYAYVSPDGKAAAYSASNGLWIASLDRRTQPRQLVPEQTTRPIIGASGDIYFRAGGFAYRIKPDGSGRRQIWPGPVAILRAISPDERWAVVRLGDDPALQAIPLNGGNPVRICDRCYVDWPADGRAIAFFWGANMGQDTVTVAVPLKAGSALPPLPGQGFRTKEDMEGIPGARVIPHYAALAPGFSTYAFDQTVEQRNLYRVPLPQ
jgi:Tol biopolymer transport system component